MTGEYILKKVEELLAKWQEALGKEVQIVLGGSLVSGLFIIEGSDVIDVDVRFLVDDPNDSSWIARIEKVTGLKCRKTIEVGDWPQGKSTGVMIEGHLDHPELDVPLDCEGCLRNRKYVGWARFYPQVFSECELEEIRRKKIELRSDKKAYKAYKSDIRQTSENRALEMGLVNPDRAPFEN